MPIKTNLNISPYNDDFDINKQYYRVLFKPSFAVQARELTQLQTTLQNQIEQFGDNIFKEGSIIKGCNFTQLNTLQFVKVTDRAGFDPANYVGEVLEDGTEIFYEIEGSSTGLRASVEAATRGFQTRAPDLNTFYINYLNTASSGVRVFQAGEELVIYRRIIDATGNSSLGDNTRVDAILVAPANATGNSFGLRVSEGVIYQKGHFLFADEQLVIVSKYTNEPNNVSVGYLIEEELVTFLQDNELLDNANGSPNQNAPGADRLKLVPILSALDTIEAEADTQFFTLARYVNGNAVMIRDVSQYNVLGEEMARRTYEESGDYVVKPFNTQVVEKNGELKVSVGSGVAYVKGYRVESRGDYQFPIIDVTKTEVKENQPISFDYGRFVQLTTSANAISGNFNIPSYETVTLETDAEEEIGTAIVKNITQKAVYLFEIDMNTDERFADVAKISGSSGHVNIVPEIRNDKNGAFIFETGMFSVKSVTDISLPVRERKSITITSDTIEIQANPGEDFATTNTKDEVIVVDVTNMSLSIQSVTTIDNNSKLRVVLVPGQDVIGSLATVYYNKRLQSTEPHIKVAKETYVKVNSANNTIEYNLGFPDVFEIVEILDEAEQDVTDSFKLVTNQNDHYYDHSYIKFITGRREPQGVMTIKMKVFELNSTQGDYFFTINSYPNDFEADKIPNYKSTSGKAYNLRDCFDFRPYVDVVSGADYNVTSPLSAPVIPSAINLTPSFSIPPLIPALNAFATADIEHYLNRNDVIAIDSYGNITLINGEESTLSKTINTNGLLVVAEIFVPGFPAISSARAARENKSQYAVKIVSKGTKVYTMSDIANIEKTVSKLTYYASLNALELSTQSINVRDENGLSRFKNGIIVDAFNDFMIADTTNPDFYAGLDFTEKSLTPPVRTIPMNLSLKSSTSASLHPNTTSPEVATLLTDAIEVPFISQPYATNARNCVSNFYNYNGTGFLFPEYDGGPDTVTNPGVNFDVDIQSLIEDLVDNIQEFIPLTATSSELIGSTQSATTTENIFTDTFRDIQQTLTVSSGASQSATAEFATNVQFTPFMRQKQIRVAISGLRPDSQHYVFFDREDVNSLVEPGELVSGDDISQESVRNIKATSIAGQPLITNEFGELFFIFNLPESTFYVGDRMLLVSDVDNYDDIETASTSAAYLTYRAYNFSADKSSLTLSTRVPNVSTISTSTERDVTRRETITNNGRGGGRGIFGVAAFAMLLFDPIAQTFFIKKAMTGDSKNLFLSQIDLYFKTKSATKGITVELREVINGYPSYQIVPFSKIKLPARLVQVSADGSVPTAINFPVPIRLESDREYAFVIIPDGADPSYLVHTSKVGGTDNITGNVISQDAFDGMLFTSTNNRTWQSYQDEDIKFTLYRSNFAASAGSVTLTNSDGEFFTLENTTGRFKTGESVYALKDAIGLTASATRGSKTITSIESLSSIYSAGDYVLVGDTGDIQKRMYRVVDSGINAGTNFLLLDAPVVFKATSNNVSSINIKPVVVGEINYHDSRKPTFMSIENSSARLSRSFVASDVVYGMESNANAVISSVDDISISYIQPLIAKTNDSFTNATMNGKFTRRDNINSFYEIPMPFNDKTEFNVRGMQLRSKSNDLAGESKFDITITMSNQEASTTTPFVDVETAMVLANQYRITSSTEPTLAADVPARYISKTIELAEGFDAEDFRLYVTGYRPLNTDIKTYIKIQNAADPYPFESANWIELDMIEGNSVYSSTTNTSDFREFVYEIPSTLKTGLNGEVRYTNDSGAYDGYRRFAIKIVLLADDINRVPKISDYRGIALT